MTDFDLSSQDVIDLEASVKALVTDQKNEELRNNHRFWKIFNKEDGLWKKMTRRQFIERYVKIRNKDGEIVPFILNDAQRRLEAEILKLERKNVPVRIIILKARQMGFSTYVNGFNFELVMRRSYRRVLIIAHRQPTSRLLINMARRMLSLISKTNGEPWEFKMDARRMDRLSWGEPINSEIEITSAEVAEPGHGDTCQAVHMSETSRWPDAETKAKGVMQILPMKPWTYGFSESTANGDDGYFRDEFWLAWNERSLDITSPARSTPWVAMFYPWFWHQEYRWTQTFGSGRELPADLIAEMEDTLSEEEEWLLKQKYFCKGRGEVTVDYDQLAWRRMAIPALCSSSMIVFNEQYPSRPELAFAASGNPAFDHEAIRRWMDFANAHQPAWEGLPAEMVSDV